MDALLRNGWKKRGLESTPVVPVVVDLDSTFRTCRTCFRELPLRAFRRRQRREGYRHHTCDECERVKQNARNAHRRTLATRRELARLMTQLRLARNDRAVSVAASKMLTAFGGVEGFAAKFAEYVRFAQHQIRKCGRGAPLYKAMSVLLRMWVYLDSRKEAKLADMPTEDLHSHLLSAAKELIATRPDALADLLRAHGYTVTRSDNTCANESCDTSG